MRGRGWLLTLVVLVLVLVLVPTAAAQAFAAAPEPPPIRVGPPAGDRPGPAAGLRVPQRCGPGTPPAGTPPWDVPARLELDQVHRLATGRGVLIAVIDTGVAPHPLLGSRLRGGGDYLTGGDGLEDCDGHGTAVAGLLAAGSDGNSPIGIAPQAEILTIRQSSPSFDVPTPDGGRRAAGDTDTLAESVVLATRAGADVINISEAVCLPHVRAAPTGARLQAALRHATESDVVVVAAAGNVGSGSCAQAAAADQVALPGWYDADVLTVAAVGADDTPTPFTVPGPWVDVAAPGVGLRSLAVGGATTTGLDGTSFAAPWVAGLAALIRERYPDLAAQQVVDRILGTARRSPANPDAVGQGVVDPLAALTAVSAEPVPQRAAAPPPATAPLAGTTPRAPPTASTGPVDLIAAAVLVAAAAAAATTLRRRI